MKRIIGSASIIFIVFVLIIAMAALTGCGGKNEEPEANNEPPQLMGTTASNDPAMTSPAGNTSLPAPGTASPTGTTPSTTPSVGGDSQMAGAVPKVPFSQAPVKSAITYITDKQNGVQIKFLRFKYADTNGNIRTCEIPEVETKENRTIWNWINTFDVYSLPVVEKDKKKAKPTRLDDFPFISPKPSDNSTQTASGQSGSGGFSGFGGSQSGVRQAGF